MPSYGARSCKSQHRNVASRSQEIDTRRSRLPPIFECQITSSSRELRQAAFQRGLRESSGVRRFTHMIGCAFDPDYRREDGAGPWESDSGSTPHPIEVEARTFRVLIA